MSGNETAETSEKNGQRKRKTATSNRYGLHQKPKTPKRKKKGKNRQKQLTTRRKKEQTTLLSIIYYNVFIK